LRASFKPLDAMQPASPRRKWTAKLDFGIASCLGALSFAFVHMSNSAAEEAMQHYGHNVDSGVWYFVIAELYLAPLTVLFGFAALALSRNWRGGPYAHRGAIAAIFGLPFIDYALLF